MATLIISAQTFEIEDITLTYPPTLGGSMGAYSTDFDLPDASAVRQALGIFSLLSLENQGQRKSCSLVVGAHTYACHILPTEVKEGKITCSLEVYYLPEVFHRRICDLAAESGNDLLFGYGVAIGQGDWPAELDGYAYYTGIGSGITSSGGYRNDRQLPSLTIQMVALWLRLVTGVQIDFSSLADLQDTYITLASLRYSPLWRHLYFQPTHPYGDGECIGGKWEAAVTFVRLFPQVAAGQRVKVTAYNPSGDNINVEANLNGTVLAVTAVPAGGTAVILDADYTGGAGDFIRFSSVTLGGALTLDYDYERPDTPEGWGEKAKVQNNTYATVFYDHFSQKSQHVFGFFGCITATPAQLLSDLAVCSGKVLTFDGSTISLVDRSVRPTKAWTNGYVMGNGNFGRRTMVSFGGDEVLARTYDDTHLEDEKVVLELKAKGMLQQDYYDIGGVTTAVGIANVWDGTNFVADGEYYFSLASSEPGWTQKVLTMLPVRVVNLLPTRGQIVTMNATTRDDITDTTAVEVEGRDWLVVEKEVSNKGFTDFEAVLLR